MPLYDVQCEVCNRQDEIFRSIARMNETPMCCNHAMVRRIGNPQVVKDIQPWEAYESPASGKIITSKAERRADMKATGCRDWEGRASEERQAARIRGYDAAVNEQKLDKTVRTAWAQLSPERRAQALRGMR